METPFTAIASDGYALRGMRFAPDASRGDEPVVPRGAILVAGATGVPQRFYRQFGRYAAARGFITYTIDYRGIGESAPRTLRGFRMDYRDWARLDLAALARHIADDSAVRGLPLFYVGHSYGGHALGLLSPEPGFTAAAFFGVGAGWSGWMPAAERVKVSLMWNVLGPALVAWRGYLPWSMLRMGEDLPVDVYRQWRHWCRFPRYFFDDPAIGAEMRATFARVRVPIRAWNAADDVWAPAASRDAFVRTGYTAAPLEMTELDPRPLGGGVGHMGYFRPAASALWDEALHWFSART